MKKRITLLSLLFLLGFFGCKVEEIEIQPVDFEAEGYELITFREFATGAQFYYLRKDDNLCLLLVEDGEKYVFNDYYNNLDVAEKYYQAGGGKYLILSADIFLIDKSMSMQKQYVEPISEFSTSQQQGIGYIGSDPATDGEYLYTIPRETNDVNIHIYYHNGDRLKQDSIKILKKYIKSVARDPDGNGFWVGALDLAHYYGNTNDLIAFSSVQSYSNLVFDSKKQLWGFNGDKLFMYDHQLMNYILPTNSNLEAHSYTKFFLDKNDVIWLQDNSKFYAYDPNQDVFHDMGSLGNWGKLIVSPDAPNSYVIKDRMLYKIENYQLVKQKLP